LERTKILEVIANMTASAEGEQLLNGINHSITAPTTGKRKRSEDTDGLGKKRKAYFDELLVDILELVKEYVVA
jgi:hypothetical protein